MTRSGLIYLSKGDRRDKCVDAGEQEVAERWPPTQRLTLRAVLRGKPSSSPSERHLCNLYQPLHTHPHTHCLWLTAQCAPPAFMLSDAVFTQVLPWSRLRAGEPPPVSLI